MLCHGDETAKSIAVIDLAGVSMGDLAGDNMAFLKKTIGIANQHYPERSLVIFIINAPFYFSMAWKIVKPMVHENTQKKIRILSPKETLKGLQEHIDISDIPEYYGGQKDYGGHDSVRFCSPETVEMNEYVRRLNEGASSTKVPFNDEAPVSTRDTATSQSTLPPGNPGDTHLPNSGNIGPAGPAVNTPRSIMGRRSSLAAVTRRGSVNNTSLQNVSEGQTDHGTCSAHMTDVCVYVYVHKHTIPCTHTLGILQVP
ncbi:hypothetical protein EON64_07755 [archaeon]|nr:MAG: hypothetical protein EON64_07755 [archaeon]